MGLDALWTTPLGIFYVVVSVVLFAVYKEKFTEKYAVFFSFVTIMIAREFWECPIFLFAYLNWFGHSPNGFFSQLFTFVLFLIIISYLKIEVTLKKVGLPLLIAFAVNFLLLFFFNSDIVGYIARIIGFATITYILMNAKIGVANG